MSGKQSNNNDNIEGILAAVNDGDSEALHELIETVYPELKRLAHFQLSSERSDHTLNTTAIVHEAYLRLAANNSHWNDRKHFLRAAATVMRHLLVDHARRKNAGKRGDGKANLALEDEQVAASNDAMAVLELDRAMKDIAAIDQRLEKIIECRFFAGLTVAETAEALDLSARTVERDWQRARGYLVRAMERDEH